MALTIQVLGQVRPSNTNNLLLYQPGTGIQGIIRSITVCNTSTSDAKFRIFIDPNSTDATEAEALFWDAEIKTGTTVDIAISTGLDQNGTLTVRTDTADALTFTAHGGEID